MRNVRALRVGLLLALLAASCGPSWEEIKAEADREVEAFRPEAEAVLAKLAAIGAEAAALPAPLERPLDLGADGPRDTANMEVPHGTDTILIAIEHLTTSEAACEDAPLGFDFLSLERLRGVVDGDSYERYSLIDVERMEGNREALRRPLERLTNARWLIVLRTHEIVEPKIESLTAAAFGAGDGTEENAGTFVPGRFRGDALVYDLEDSHLAGVIPLDVGSSESVRLSGDPNALLSDLRYMVFKTLRAALDGPPPNTPR